MRTGPERWSSKLGFYLAAPGAAVGLGSIWRFPYLTGTNGGSAFVFVFILACLAIATPLLAAEFVIGRRSRRNPAEAAGEVVDTELPEETAGARRLVVFLLRYVCPLGIAAVLVTTLA